MSKTLGIVATALELIRRLADYFRSVKRENDRQAIMDDPLGGFIDKYGMPDSKRQERGDNTPSDDSL